MRRRGESGIWELFLPGIGQGEAYKYEVLANSDSPVQQKADPCGFHAEVRPLTASIVFDLNRYQWQDEQWMTARAQSNTAEMLQRAIVLYENVEVEQALVILNQVVSPQSPFVVTPPPGEYVAVPDSVSVTSLPPAPPLTL